MHKILCKKLLGIVVLGLLFSNTSYASNDIYFCEMTKIIEMRDGKVEIFKNEKFKFKREKDHIKFGSEKNIFENLKMDINFSSGEMFDGGRPRMAFSYEDGKFYLSLVLSDKILSVSAECTTF